MIKLKDLLNLKKPTKNTTSESQCQQPQQPKPNPKIQFTEIWTGKELSIKCRYMGKPRHIHPAVCEWHRLEMDEECRASKCPRISFGWGGGGDRE